MRKWLLAILVLFLVITTMTIACGASEICAEHQFVVIGENADGHELQCTVCSFVAIEMHGNCESGSTTCRTCGRARELCNSWADWHRVSEQNLFDEKSDWSTCAFCGETIGVSPHYANCQNKDVCERCGHTVSNDGIIIDHFNHYSTQYQAEYSDDYCHWAVCEYCGDKVYTYAHYDYNGDGFCDESYCGHEIKPCPGHQYEVAEIQEYGHILECSICYNRTTEYHGSCDPMATTCAICGYEREKCDYWDGRHISHGQYSFDAQSHWVTCEICGEAIDPIRHSAGCIEDKCPTCGGTVSGDNIVLGDIIHKTPVYAPEYADEYCHWAICEDCGQKAYCEPHMDWDYDGICDAEFCRHEVTKCPEHQYQVIDIYPDSHDVECSVCHEEHTFIHGSCDPDATACAVCGRSRAECTEWDQNHFSSNHYSHNEKFHWNTCLICGKIICTEMHTVDCSSPERCLVCGCTVNEDDIEIGCTLHSACINDPQYADEYCHWAVCDTCGEATCFERHIDYDGDGYCDLWCCGHEIKPCPGHQYELIGIQEYGHELRCSICYETLIESHGNCDPTATACAICGQEQVLCGSWSGNHITRDYYLYDADSHWQICEACGDKIYPIMHSGFCSEDRCIYCDRTVSEDHIVIGDLRHRYSEYGTEYADIYYHWTVCQDCGQPVGYDQHWDGDYDGLCDTCGYTYTACPGHDYALVSINDTVHTLECTICHATAETNHGSCDPEATACAFCGRERDQCRFWDVNHCTDRTICSDENMHWAICLVCGQKTDACYHYSDCRDADRCQACGKTVSKDHIVIKDIIHSQTEYSSDYADNYCHWEVCRDCRERVYYNTHYDYDGNSICDTCGHLVKSCPKHEYEVVCSVNDTAYYHLLECKFCHQIIWQRHGSCDPDATKCMLCGMDRSMCASWVKGHRSSGLFTCDAENHRTTCLICGEEYEEVHRAVCWNPEYCEECECSVFDDEIIIGELTHLNVYYSTEYADEDNHWGWCVYCNQNVNVEAHYDRDGDGLCDFDYCKHPVHIAEQISVTVNGNQVGGPGETLELQVTVIPGNPTGTYTFSSSNDGVATVTETGMITFVNSGNAIITVASETGNVEPTLLPVVCKDGNILKTPTDLKRLDTEALTGTGAGYIVLNTGLETIGEKALSECKELYAIEIPETVTEIAANAFDNCGIVTIIASEDSFAYNFAIQNDILVIPQRHSAQQ